MDKKKAQGRVPTKVLGRGMASLIPDPSVLDDKSPPPRTYFYCDIETIKPNPAQPRKRFSEEGIKELSASLKEKGILQPLLVRRVADFEYELIAGERRWRAAQKAGFKQVPVIIRESSGADLLEDALIENIQREDLNEIEEAKAYEALMNKHGYTQDMLAQRLSKNRSTIANTLRLLSLAEVVQQFLIEEKLSAGHVRPLIAIEDHEVQVRIAKEVISKSLSVRETEALVKGEGHTKHKTTTLKKKDEFIELLENELTQHFKAKVRIENYGQKKGKVMIEFFGEEELSHIVSLLKA